ncbi:hypothetical protein EI94DRAFT_601898 [Lactarius quietus]|nr:hypothetical protein EI94DRAFT_601898 [Lactarius quietus]
MRPFGSTVLRTTIFIGNIRCVFGGFGSGAFGGEITAALLGVLAKSAEVQHNNTDSTGDKGRSAGNTCYSSSYTSAKSLYYSYITRVTHQTFLCDYGPEAVLSSPANSRRKSRRVQGPTAFPILLYRYTASN